MPAGLDSSAAVAAPPSPVFPAVPVALPAMVEILPVDALTFWIRLLLESAMYRFPDESIAMSLGLFSRAATAGPPLPLDPGLPFADPAMVDTCPAVRLKPHWLWVLAAISTIRLLPASAMYMLPSGSSAWPAGLDSKALIGRAPAPG